MTKANPLLRLHIQFVDLCANDILTHEEHDAFEKVLQRVLDRRGWDAITEPEPFQKHEEHE